MWGFLSLISKEKDTYFLVELLHTLSSYSISRPGSLPGWEVIFTSPDKGPWTHQVFESEMVFTLNSIAPSSKGFENR